MTSAVPSHTSFATPASARLPHVGVIIATYNRAALLDDCLRHLAKQDFAPGDEVIVVDNGSTDGTGDIVRRRQPTFPVPLYLLFERRPGKSRALGAALSFASREVLAFIDDDVNVCEGWLEALRTAMSDPVVALVGGRVAPRWESTVPRWMRGAPLQHARLGAPLGLLDYDPSVVDLGPRTALGGNMAVRRDVLMQLGGFATHLGKFRGTLLSGEDHELCRRVQREGFRAIYVPDAVVQHWVPADRTRVTYFLHWFYWSGITNAILDRETPGRPAGTRLPLYFLKRAAVGAAGACGALLACRPASALCSAADCAFSLGYIAERVRPRAIPRDYPAGGRP